MSEKAKCDKCGILTECCKAKINTGHFGFMTTFAKCVGAVFSTNEVEEELLVRRVFRFCDKCVSILMPKASL